MLRGIDPIESASDLGYSHEDDRAIYHTFGWPTRPEWGTFVQATKMKEQRPSGGFNPFSGVIDAATNAFGSVGDSVEKLFTDPTSLNFGDVANIQLPGSKFIAENPQDALTLGGVVAGGIPGLLRTGLTEIGKEGLRDTLQETIGSRGSQPQPQQGGNMGFLDVLKNLGGGNSGGDNLPTLPIGILPGEQGMGGPTIEDILGGPITGFKLPNFDLGGGGVTLPGGGGQPGGGGFSLGDLLRRIGGGVGGAIGGLRGIFGGGGQPRDGGQQAPIPGFPGSGGNGLKDLALLGGLAAGAYGLANRPRVQLEDIMNGAEGETSSGIEALVAQEAARRQAAEQQFLGQRGQTQATIEELLGRGTDQALGRAIQSRQEQLNRQGLLNGPSGAMDFALAQEAGNIRREQLPTLLQFAQETDRGLNSIRQAGLEGEIGARRAGTERNFGLGDQRRSVKLRQRLIDAQRDDDRAKALIRLGATGVGYGLGGAGGAETGSKIGRTIEDILG